MGAFPSRQARTASHQPAESGNDPAASLEETLKDSEAVTIENAQPPPLNLPATGKGWKISRTGGGDTAMALFESPSDVDALDDPQEIRQLVRKIDLMILPCIAVCYAFFYIDKTTLSYAAIFGIRDDLGLEGNRYNWLSSIFYFGFLAWAFPTNFLLQRLPVAKYLGVNIFLWGALLMCQAAVKNYTQLMVIRALSGAAEACSDPSFMLITSMWYTRRQQPIRVGLWYTANGLGIAGGGLLGYGIGHIKGALASWRYEFLVVGALCCVWGIVIFLILPDSPVTAPLLTPRQRRIAVERLRENQTGVENKHFKWYQFVEALKDYKTWFFFILGIIQNVPNGGISNFGTLIIKGFGFSTLVTTLMQVPYGCLIALLILSCVYLNDFTATRRRMNTRCFFIILYCIPNIVGSFGLRFVPQQHHVARLWCYYLTGAYNASFVLVLSLSIANTAGHTKKVVTNAFLFLGYCTGNIVGPFFYKTNQAPTYPLGIGSMIFCQTFEIAVVLAFRCLLSRENKRRDRIFGEMSDRTKAELDETAFGDMTDRENENFRYVY